MTKQNKPSNADSSDSTTKATGGRVKRGGRRPPAGQKAKASEVPSPPPKPAGLQGGGAAQSMNDRKAQQELATSEAVVAEAAATKKRYATDMVTSIKVSALTTLQAKIEKRLSGALAAQFQANGGTTVEKNLREHQDLLEVVVPVMSGYTAKTLDAGSVASYSQALADFRRARPQVDGVDFKFPDAIYTTLPQRACAYQMNIILQDFHKPSRDICDPLGLWVKLCRRHADGSADMTSPLICPAEAGVQMVVEACGEKAAETTQVWITESSIKALCAVKAPSSAIRKPKADKLESSIGLSPKISLFSAGNLKIPDSGSKSCIWGGQKK